MTFLSSFCTHAVGCESEILGFLNLWVAKPMFCTPGVFHENDGNHKNERHSDGILTARKKALSAGFAEITKITKSTRTTRIGDAKHRVPQKGFRNTQNIPVLLVHDLFKKCQGNLENTTKDSLTLRTLKNPGKKRIILKRPRNPAARKTPRKQKHQGRQGQG